MTAVSQAEVMLPHTKTEDLDRVRTQQLASAPTRELGLRGAKPTENNMGEGTRYDIVLPFDQELRIVLDNFMGEADLSVTDSRGKLLAHGTSTLMVLRPEKERGKSE